MRDARGIVKTTILLWSPMRALLGSAPATCAGGWKFSEEQKSLIGSESV
jgi:hypothetical protein